MRRALVVILLLLMGVTTGRASIVYDFPAGITSPPTGDAGWSLTGSWQVGGGVPVAPDYFLTAQHLGGGGGQFFILNGASYQASAFFDIAGTDLRLVKIAGTFPNYAPLYRDPAGSEVNQAISMIGFGHYAQGAPFVTNGIQNGWTWGAATGKNFAMNTVAAITPMGTSKFLDYTFDPVVGRNEGIYTVGDSGGGAFISTGGGAPWRLAGIAYSITDFYTFDPSTNTYTPLVAPDGSSGAAVYDSTGLYTTDANGNHVPASGPQHGFATEVAAFLPQIDAVILPGDISNDGVVNFSDLLTLAQHYGQAVPPFTEGDVNGDGTVNFSDLLLLAQNYGQSLTSGISPVPTTGTTAAAVPEAGMAAMIALVLVCCRRRNASQ
jgi:hypothetical protein